MFNNSSFLQLFYQMRLSYIVHRTLALKPRNGKFVQGSVDGVEFMQAMTVPLHIAQSAFHQVTITESLH